MRKRKGVARSKSVRCADSVEAEFEFMFLTLDEMLKRLPQLSALVLVKVTDEFFVNVRAPEVKRVEIQ